MLNKFWHLCNQVKLRQAPPTLVTVSKEVRQQALLVIDLRMTSGSAASADSHTSCSATFIEQCSIRYRCPVLVKGRLDHHLRPDRTFEKKHDGWWMANSSYQTPVFLHTWPEVDLIMVWGFISNWYVWSYQELETPALRKTLKWTHFELICNINFYKRVWVGVTVKA